MAGRRGQADVVGGCLAQGAPRALGTTGTVGPVRPGVEPVRRQHWKGWGGVAALATGVPSGTEAEGEREDTCGPELCGDQPSPPPLLGGVPVVDSKGALEHREPGALVRDVTFDADRSQIRTAAVPQVMAVLRNLTAPWCARRATPTWPPLCAATPVTYLKPSLS